MSMITKKFYVDDVLVDPSLVQLCNYGNTYGVRRVDNLAVVVAAATAMTKLSTGIYNYSFTDPAYNLTYEYWVKFTIDGNTYYSESTVQGELITAGYTLREMLDQLGMMINEINQADDQPLEFTPAQLVMFLNKAQNEVVTLLEKHVLDALDTSITAQSLDANGAFDLSTLASPVWQRTKGIDGIKITGHDFCKLISYDEWRTHSDAAMTYSTDNPKYYVRGTKVYVKPTGDTIDIDYKREPVKMVLGASAAYDVNCEFTYRIGDAIVSMAASYGYDVGHDDNRARKYFDESMRIISELNDKPASDSIRFGVRETHNKRAIPATGGSRFNFTEGE